MKLGEVARNYATVIATSKDGMALEKSKSILLLASSGAENTNMKWNEDRTSVSNQWGTGPTTINPVSGTVKMAHQNADRVKIFALDGTGKRTMNVELKQTSAGIEFEIGAKYGTLWYEIAVE